MAFPEYPKLPSYPELCEQMLSFWQRKNIFARSINERKDSALPWVFYEGPPSANGPPGIHHMMGRTLKDVFCRYYALKGHPVPRQAGWDTHGLPIELSVEKKLGIRKEDIGVKLSVEEFNRHCLEAVHLHQKDWEHLTHKMGFWVDMEKAYSTCSSQYMESLWWMVSQLHKKGYLRKGYSVQPYSPMAGTALSSHELNQPGCYRDVWDHTVVAQFALKENLFSQITENHPIYLLAWTTTPWTLPANVALCVSSKLNYSLACFRLPHREDLLWVIMAQDALTRYGKTASLEELQAQSSPPSEPFYYEAKSMLGEELIGLSYNPPFHLVDLPQKKIHQVVADDFVSTEEGTGMVHLAPCYGGEDELICRREGMASLHIVDDQGHYKPDVKDLGGRAIKPAYEALQTKSKTQEQSTDPSQKLPLDVELIKDLKERGLAFSWGKYQHSYPHCWRTDQPIVYMPVDAWFITTTKARERLLELNNTIKWFPSSTGKSRFGDWLKGVVDWNLSRSRFWGTPLPIWCSKDGTEIKVIGSLSELKEEIIRSIDQGLMKENFLENFDPENLSEEHYRQFDLHRTVVDQVILVNKKGEPLYRETDVMDVWFDSGAMPYAAAHYPFQNQDHLLFPADFIAEGVDQTRGWFFSLHVLATLCWDQVAYKKVLAHGLVLDKKGQKMSKRLGNTVEPIQLIDQWGADVVRWYMLSHAKPWDDLKFDEDQIRVSTQKFFDTLFHTYHFFAMYANLDGFSEDLKNLPSETSSHLWDQWLHSELQGLQEQVNGAMEQCDPCTATRTLQHFTIEKLSNWYVRNNRRRFWQKDQDHTKTHAYRTLGYALYVISRLIAPYAPMSADFLYRDLQPKPNSQNATRPWYDSVHLEQDLAASTYKRQPLLEKAMALVRQVTSMALSLREQAKMRVRQPLPELWVLGGKELRGEELFKAFPSLFSDLCTEINIKKLLWAQATDPRWKKIIKPHYPRLGKKLGASMKEAAQVIERLSDKQINQLLQGQSLTLELSEASFTLLPEDVSIRYTGHENLWINSEGDLGVALNTQLSEDLRREGVARELINRIQNARKSAGYHITDHITITVSSDPRLKAACEQFRDYIQEQTLAQNITLSDPPLPEGSETLEFDGIKAKLFIERVP